MKERIIKKVQCSSKALKMTKGVSKLWNIFILYACYYFNVEQKKLS